MALFFEYMESIQMYVNEFSRKSP